MTCPTSRGSVHGARPARRSPAPVRAASAAAWVWPTTLGTSTSAGPTGHEHRDRRAPRHRLCPPPDRCRSPVPFGTVDARGGHGRPEARGEQRCVGRERRPGSRRRARRRRARGRRSTVTVGRAGRPRLGDLRARARIGRQHGAGRRRRCRPATKFAVKPDASALAAACSRVCPTTSGIVSVALLTVRVTVPPLRSLCPPPGSGRSPGRRDVLDWVVDVDPHTLKPWPW